MELFLLAQAHFQPFSGKVW